MKKVIIILSAVLILLIFITVLISNLTSRKSDKEQTALTPTSAADFPGQSGTRGDVGRPLTSVERTRLESLESAMPYEEDEFLIDYATAEGELDQFVVVEKTDDAESKIDEWFAGRGLSKFDYKNRGESLVVIKGEEEFTLSPEEEEALDSDPSLPNKDLELLTDLLKTLLAFEFEELEAPTPIPTQVQAPQQEEKKPDEKEPVSKCRRYSAGDILSSSRIRLTSSARSDLRAGVVDQRLLNAIGFILERHRIAVSVFRYQNIKRINPHYFGRAVDIYEVDGRHVSGSNTQARRLIEEIIKYPCSNRPNEVGIPLAWKDLQNKYRKPGFALFARSDHNNHLHIAFSR